MSEREREREREEGKKGERERKDALFLCAFDLVIVKPTRRKLREDYKSDIQQRDLSLLSSISPVSLPYISLLSHTHQGTFCIGWIEDIF